jgi:hypothetical protein
MKEQKNSIGMSLSGYTTNSKTARPNRKARGITLSESKNEIPFRSLVGACLLITGICHVVMCYLITDCSDGYKYIKVLYLFSALY